MILDFTFFLDITIYSSIISLYNKLTDWLADEIVAMTNIVVSATIILSVKFVISKKNDMNPTSTKKNVCINVLVT